MRLLRSESGFITLIAFLFVLLIIGILYFVMLSPEYNNPSLKQEIHKTGVQTDIDTASYQSVLESTKSEIKRIEKLQLDQAQQTDLFKIPGE